MEKTKQKTESTRASPTLHVKLPRPTERTLNKNIKKNPDVLYASFSKHIQILDIQCISKSSVLGEIKKKKLI